MPGAWVVPTLAGAIAVGFNVPGIHTGDLRIPREVLAEIFLGKLRRWSELAEFNPQLPQLELMTQNISLVVRSDSSGSTEAFTEALSSFSAEFKARVGKSALPNWPVVEFRAKGVDDAAVQIRVVL
jgi:phosphate transport system substrate-binding protein